MGWVNLISATFIFIGIGCGMVRLFKGPDILNRILAFDYLCASVIALDALRSIELGTDRFLDPILIFSLLGFATVIAFMEVFFARVRREEGD